MRKLLYILLLLPFVGISQTTNFSFSSLSFSSTDLKNPNRGFETWMGSNTAWSNTANGVKLPTSSDVRGYNFYKRINWAQIENPGSGTTPANPRYDWAFLFDDLVKSAIDNGQMFSFGILDVAPGYNAAGGASKNYGTPGGKNLCYPTWLHNAMQTESTKDVLYTDDWVPDWNSNTYLTALDSLNNAIAAHIAATSYTPSTGPWAGISVPFSKVIFCIDIRGYGQSGEWNMSGYSPTGGGFAIDYEIAQGRHPTANTLKRMINSHKNAFPDYYLVSMTDGFDTDAGNSSVIPDSAVYFLLNYSNNKGRFGWRRDNWANIQDGKLENNPLVMGGWHADTAISNRWKYAPVTGEPYAGSYTGMGGSPYANMPEEAKRYHASLIGNGNFYTYSAQMGDSIIKASKWLGYRLEPISGYMTTTLTQNQNFTVSNTWRNSGIAPVYLPTKIKYELRTSADALLATWTSAFSPTKFLPGDSTVTETFNLGSVATGTTHKLNVIFVDSLGYAIPIKLALTSPAQNSDGSYTLRSNITVQAGGNAPPVSNAGADQVLANGTTTATLNGTGSTDDVAITAYLWSNVSGPNTPSITSPTSATTGVTGLVTGTYLFRLLVTDGGALTDDDTVQIRVNALPVANAGADQNLAFGTTSTTLNGSSSSDPDGTITAYAWSQITGTAATIVSPSSASTSVTGLTTGTRSFKLTVTDNNSATKSDTIIVTVLTPTRHKLTMTKERVYKRNGLPNEVLAENFVDDDTLTAVCSGFAQSVISKPTHLWYELPNDSTYNDLIFEIYNGAASPGTLSFTLFNKDFSDSVVVSKNMTINSWNWVDTASTKAFTPFVKYIRYNWGSECASATTEMRVYAVNKDTATWRIPTSNVSIAPFAEFLGVNIEGSENDTLLNGGTLRSFQERWYRDSTATLDTSARTLVTSVFGDGETQLAAYRSAGFKHLFAFEGAIRSLQTPVPSNPTNYGSFSVDKKNMMPGADSTLPSAWVPSAQEAYIIAAWTGRNASANLGPHVIKNSAGANATKGRNYVDIFETTNEWDAYWNVERFHNAQVRSARLSAEADGHMGLLGAYKGVKVADPTMKVYSGALVFPDSIEIKSDAFYTYKLRGRNNDPRDGIVLNQYLTNGGVQGGGTNGVSPGQYNLWDRASEIKSIRDRYFAGRRIGIGEGAAYDKRQNTAFSALAHGTIDSLVAQANYATQSVHIYRAMGVDFVYMYKCLDNIDLSAPGSFPQQSMGQSNPTLSFKKWPIYYWVSSMYGMCKKYNTKLPTIISRGDSTGLAHIKYDSSAADGTDTVTHVYWMATNNDSYQTVSLNVGASMVWAEKVIMADKDADGVHVTLSPSGNILSLGSIGETPVYVRYVLGNPPIINPPGGFIKRKNKKWRPIVIN